MDFLDRQSPVVDDEKTFDETTVFINANGSVSKRRRRKSLGRRVSFAEEPKLHIFPRDDEYETPTRATADSVAGSPRSGGKRRSPRIAAKVVDADKENRVLNANPNSQRGRRNGPIKPLLARGEGSPALKPQNWLDERDNSSLAGNDEDNTGPVDLRHLSFDVVESEMDDENLTLDSTTFAYKFSLHRSKSVELPAVQPDRNGLAISAPDAFPDDEDVLEKDVSFVMDRQLLRISESQEGVGQMTGDMSISMPIPTGQRNLQTLAGENSSPNDSMNSSDQRIPETGRSSLPGSKDDNSSRVINSLNAETSPVLVPHALRALMEERFGTGFVGDKINVTPESALRAELEARFGTGFGGDEINGILSDQRIPASRKLSLPGSRDDTNSATFISSMDLDTVDVLAHPEARLGNGFVGDAIVFTTESEGNVEATGSVDMSVSSHSLMPMGFTITMGVPSLRDLIRKEEKEEKEEMRMAGVAFDGRKETLNPTEGAEMMLTEGELAATDIPPKGVDARPRDIFHGGRETINLIEDSEMMLTEAEFTVADSPPKDVEARSTGTSLADLERVRQMPRATESFNPAEEAEMMLMEAEFTGADSPSVNVDVKLTDVWVTDLQRARETQSQPPDTNMGTVKYTASESHHHPQIELYSTQEMGGPPEQGEMSLTETEISEGREKSNLPTDGDVTVKEVVARERQDCKDLHSSAEIATRDAASKGRMLDGEELHSSAECPDDEEVHLKNEAKETFSPLQDPDLEAAAVDTRSLQRVKEFQNPPQVTPGKRMPIAAFQEPEKAFQFDSPATTNNNESPGPNFFNRAIKRTRFGRGTSSLDDSHDSPTLDGVTAQVPRLSDLLAADMDFTSSTPVRPVSRSMWMTPPSSVTAARARDDSPVVMVSDQDGEDGDVNADLTSPFDSSMEIVEPTADPIRLSLDKPLIQATPESPTTSDGQVPESFLAGKAEDVPILTAQKETGETMPPVHIPKTSQEKEVNGFLSSPSQSAPLQFLKTKGKVSEQDRPALREITDPSQILCSSLANFSEPDALDTRETMGHRPHIILRTSSVEEKRQSSMTSPRERVTAQEIKAQQNDCRQDTSGTTERTTDHTHILRAPHQTEHLDSLSNRTQSVTLEVRENHQKSIDTKEVVDRTEIMSITQPKENEKGILINGNERVGSQEKGSGHDNIRSVKEAVDQTHTIHTSLKEEQCTPSSPRPTGSSTQLIRATDLDKVDEINDFPKPEGGSKLSVDKPAPIHEDRIHEDGEDNVNVPKMSVEEFLQNAEVRFSHALPHGLDSARELLKDPSLAETHHVRSLSECFTYLCLVKPQLMVMQDACEALYDEGHTLTTEVAELEALLTARNPAVFVYFQNSPDWKKQQLRKQLERIQEHYRLLAEKKRVQFQQRLETEYASSFLESKNTMIYYVQIVREERNAFDLKCRRPFRRLQANLSCREANQECNSTPRPKVLNAELHLRTTVSLERIEDLKARLKHLETSQELRLARLRPRQKAAEDTLRGLRQRVELRKKSLSDSLSQVVDKVCLGKNTLQREEVVRNPYLYVKKMRGEIILLHSLQDGFQLKSAGTVSRDPILELSYRSLLKRRYVVRKVGTAVKVLTSSWGLEPEKIDAMFPRVNASLVFSLTLTATGDGGTSTVANSTASTKGFGQLSGLEAVRFTLPSLKSGALPEPTSLKASMQVTRMLVGNLMELMEEVGKCQRVVNVSCGGGAVTEPRFQKTPDGQLQLELKFIDCVSSIKFSVILDMSYLSLNGYPLGDLPAKVEIAYCAPKARDRFNRELLEDLLSRVEPGYQRLVRTYAAVGAFLASVRRGV